MLPASLRFPLRTHPEFFDTAQRRRFPHLLIFFRRENAADSPSLRFATIIKKTHGNAVERAVYKRTLRESIIHLSQTNPEFLTLPYSLVLMPLGKVQSQSTYEQELTQFLESAR